MEEQQILNNIDHFTAETLFEFICNGTTNIEQLIANGLDGTKCRTIRALQKKRDQTDYLEQQRLENQRIKQNILNNIRCNPNFYPIGPKVEFITSENETAYENTINYFLYKNVINRDDLINCNIPQEIVDLLDNINQQELDLGETPSSIPEGYTEVYFWGIPGSGKTCALSAVLSTAQTEGFLRIKADGGPSYDYTTRLSNIFTDKNVVLPPKSPVETTQYLPFVLNVGNDAPRSVSLIELSGEIFECFYNKVGKKPMPSKQHEETFNTILKFLRGRNRKIHFFFIDYDKGKKKDKDGLTQKNYLDATAAFFADSDIFDKFTDAIYVVITKSDLMPCKENERLAHISEYLKNENFSAFIKSLKASCKQHSINAGNLTAIPFSLGKVYFQQICDFENQTAKKLIDILIKRIRPSKKSILGTKIDNLLNA